MKVKGAVVILVLMALAFFTTMFFRIRIVLCMMLQLMEMCFALLYKRRKIK